MRTEEGRLPRSTLASLRAPSFVPSFVISSSRAAAATVFALFVNVDLVAVRGGGGEASERPCAINRDRRTDGRAGGEEQRTDGRKDNIG